MMNQSLKNTTKTSMELYKHIKDHYLLSKKLNVIENINR